MDAVISIGGQSLLDAFLRILGPALQSLRAPIPIALPGLSNGLLSIRAIRPVFPSSTPERLELEVRLDLKGELLLVASVPALELTGALTLTPKTDAATLKLPQVDAPLLGVRANTPPPTNALAYNLVGDVRIPKTDVPLDLKEILGKISIPPAGVTLPLPAVVPVPVNLSPLVARILLTPAIRDTALRTQVDIDGSTGYGVEFGFGDPEVWIAGLGPNFLPGVEAAITDAIDTVTDQLLRMNPPLAIVQPVRDLPRVATDVVNAIPGIVQTTLASAFKGLRARTGRLLYPAAGAGASCDVRALPRVGRARLTGSLDGSLVLQVAFDRTRFVPSDSFPLFIPTGLVDARVELDNGFVLSLLICLIEKVPNLSLPPGGPTITNNPPASRTATWNPVTLTVGPFALTGSLVLEIAGIAAGPAMPPAAKRITLTFVLGQSIGAPMVIGSALDIGLAFTLPIALDLSKLASITALRLSGPVGPAGVSFGLGTGLAVMLGAAGAAFALPAFAGPFLIAMPALIALGGLIAIGPHIVTAIIGTLLRNQLNQVLNGIQLLESPVALPPGILDAFGTLVPTTMVVDDLVADCVLETPTLPWTVLPMLPPPLEPVEPARVPPLVPPRTPKVPPDVRGGRTSRMSE